MPRDADLYPRSLTYSEKLTQRIERKEISNMPKIDLTEEEAAILIEILESYLSDLKTERVGTDSKKLHAAFVEREVFVVDLIARLGV